MSDKVYVSAGGTVQSFVRDGVRQPAVKVSEDGSRATLTIRTFSQVLIGVTLWSEHSAVFNKIQEGFFVAVDGQYTEETKNGTVYRNISARNLTAVPCVQRVERDVVNPVVEGSETVAAASPFTF